MNVKPVHLKEKYFLLLLNGFDKKDPHCPNVLKDLV